MKVFYRPEQVASSANLVSPSAGKPALVVSDWLARGFITREDVLGFEPATRTDLCRAHDARFVEGVLACRIENGFGTRSAAIAASLPHTSGSLLAAARYAVVHGENVCSPTSGFHHAGFDFAEGFCTFNGLMVTALALRAEGVVERVGIIDCDRHYGNGTADIIAACGGSFIEHHTMGARFQSRDDVGVDAGRFFEWLDRAIDACKNVDLLLYQAGADPHVNDPLGGVLTGIELAKRDHAVFRAFQGRALVWNLAGGYQRDLNGSIEPVLKIHRATAQVQAVYQPRANAPLQRSSAAVEVAR